jgi:hypothetical protein
LEIPISLFFVVCGMKTSFHHLQQKKQLASQLSRLCSLEIGGVRVKGGCGNKNIFIFKGIPASAMCRSNPSTPTNQTSKKMLRNQYLFLFYMA